MGLSHPVIISPVDVVKPGVAFVLTQGNVPTHTKNVSEKKIDLLKFYFFITNDKEIKLHNTGRKKQMAKRS